MSARLQTFVGLAALSLWTAALALPVVYTDSAVACADAHATWGWSVLLTGAVGPLDWQFGWYANPFILLACVQLLRHGRGFKAGLIALALAIGSFDWHEIRIDTVDHICSRGPGFYAWLASAGVVAVADLLRLVRPRRAETA